MNTLQRMDTTYKPSGGLAGIYAGEEAADKRFANDMTLGQQALSLEKSANENPLDLILKQRDSAFATQDMNPEMMASRQAGTIGKNRSLEATGFIDMFTKDAKAKQSLAEAMAKGSEAEQQATVNGLETFIAKATSGGPTGMAMAMQDLDPSAQKLVQGLMQQGQDPVKFATQLRELLVKQMTDNPKQRGEMDKQKLVNKGHMDVAGVNNQRALEIATMQENRYDKRQEMANDKAAVDSAKAIYNANRTAIDNEKKAIRDSLAYQRDPVAGERAIKALDGKVQSLENDFRVVASAKNPAEEARKFVSKRESGTAQPSQGSLPPGVTIKGAPQPAAPVVQPQPTATTQVAPVQQPTPVVSSDPVNVARRFKAGEQNFRYDELNDLLESGVSLSKEERKRLEHLKETAAFKENKNIFW